jgi:hypothetical protein
MVTVTMPVSFFGYGNVTLTITDTGFVTFAFAEFYFATK